MAWRGVGVWGSIGIVLNCIYSIHWLGGHWISSHSHASGKRNEVIKSTGCPWWCTQYCDSVRDACNALANRKFQACEEPYPLHKRTEVSSPTISIKHILDYPLGALPGGGPASQSWMKSSVLACAVSSRPHLEIVSAGSPLVSTYQEGGKAQFCQGAPIFQTHK